MADNSTKRKRTRASFNDEGTAIEITVYDRPAADGTQPPANKISFAFGDIHSSLISHFALRGVNDTLSGRLTKTSDPTAADINTEAAAFLASVKDGSWTPGRTFDEAEPSDFELAVAEATGRPVAEVQDMIEKTLAQPKLDAAGNPMMDKRTPPRPLRLYTRNQLVTALSNDPKVKPILARLTAERAKRLAAEAKAGDSQSALSQFGFGAAPAPTAAAAN